MVETACATRASWPSSNATRTQPQMAPFSESQSALKSTPASLVMMNQKPRIVSVAMMTLRHVTR